MAVTTIKSSYSLDVESVYTLEVLAQLRELAAWPAKKGDKCSSHC
jgi:hypothetical protein